jgi:hypothetical protein
VRDVERDCLHERSNNEGLAILVALAVAIAVAVVAAIGWHEASG